MRRRGTRGDEAGFTLVEVLVAFFIAALTLTMALKVLGEGAGWARRGPATALRLEEAASLLDATLAEPGLAPGERTGRFADGAPWRLRVVDVTAEVVPGAPAQLMRVEVLAGPRQGPALLSTLATVARAAP
ncbi:prepilin-type N-terminal cleavage/methylation domain-containing protein [Lichenihabitans sp. Uapishka_5]|uniref:type II secretion system protein n=1 Tax=Lichenihabitans sp. Uapishka_5 TaxID=3037302 RepID=UPI0029E7CBE4|nr:prepilin-type N-terminal cleavage/methylation domain-containing protein [Lichenihabitans sp. Uapishka_5]MDX7951712.1 prepilin-type N-terminal cleavage/methylation domain-containing protein [Lichenihabitans sp. Uapishka_5]